MTSTYTCYGKKKEIPDHVKKRRQNNRRNDKNTPSQTWGSRPIINKYEQQYKSRNPRNKSNKYSWKRGGNARLNKQKIQGSKGKLAQLERDHKKQFAENAELRH